ncbi:CBASS cGAMP-activated phospholipase [Phocoenobacter skyensis]|uniref:CBASS cGAMP-activated phospholipase n=1 Tax=Phocoenobacter skyensis TaxID=97481 RepID=A0AAJ6NEA3_9PAST|nr:CBASS cGAMP-activated phospholipase [Pasteurella skyensis]MDP8175228.1 CBASS cGAMP-activated phospholipase [Pasteurella skyensis]
MPKSFKILSLAGGGYRGLYTATVLNELEIHIKEKDPHDCIANYFDLITGTSIGGILALALAYEIPTAKIVEVFSQQGKNIFKKQTYSGYGITQAKYNSDNLKTILEEWFGEKLLGDLKHPVVIPAVNYNTGSPVTFKTAHHASFKRDWKFKIVDIALATSAAPTYFKRHAIENSEYIDGGIFANSPTLIGLHEAEIFFEKSINNVKILSIGTMSSRKMLNPKTDKKGGLTDWGECNPLRAASNIIDITLSSQQLFMQQMVKHRIKENLIEIDEILTQSSSQYVGLDEVTIEAQQVLTSNAKESAKKALGTPVILNFLKEKAKKTQFFEGSHKIIP